MLAILAFVYMFWDPGAITASIHLTETYNNTSVDLACVYQSDKDVAVGYYRQLPSERSFGRKIAIGGNATNCQMTHLPENIGCRCASNRHVTCTVYNLTTANEGEEWKCAIPNNSVGVYSNVVRISLQHTRTTASTETTASVINNYFKTAFHTESDTNIRHVLYTRLAENSGTTAGGAVISFITRLSTKRDANINSVRYSSPYVATDAGVGYYIRTELTREFNETSTVLSADRVTELFSEDWTKIVVVIASVIGGLIIVAAITVPLFIRCRKSSEPSHDPMPVGEFSGPSSTVYHSVPQRYVGTVDLCSLDSRYCIGCIAGIASQSATQSINSEATVEDGTNRTEANGDDDHYAEIQEELNSRLRARSLQEDNYSKCLENNPDANVYHYTDSMECGVSSQTNPYMRCSTSASAANKVLYAECLPNKVNSNKCAYVDIMSRMVTEDKRYEECMPDMVPADKAAYLSPTETTGTYAECKPTMVTTDNIGYTDRLPAEMNANTRLYATCMPNTETLDNNAYMQCSSTGETTNESLYAECLSTETMDKSHYAECMIDSLRTKLGDYSENIPDMVEIGDQRSTFGTFLKYKNRKDLSEKANTLQLTSAVSCQSDVRHQKSNKRYTKKKPDENMYLTAVYGPLPKR